MGRRKLVKAPLQLFVTVMFLCVLTVFSGCGAPSAAESPEPQLMELVVDSTALTATGYYGAPLSEFEVSGQVKDAASGRQITGSWAFAEDQNGVSSTVLVPEAGKDYLAVFTPRHGSEAYAPLTAQVTPVVRECSPDYRTLTTVDVPKLVAGGITLDDLQWNKGTIFPSGTMCWLDEDGRVLDGSFPVKKNERYSWRFVADGTDGLIGLGENWTLEGHIVPWPSFIPGTQEEAYGDISYKVYVPDGYTPGREVPLYMYLHGHGAAIESALNNAELVEFAERENCLILMPQQPKTGLRSGLWRWFLMLGDKEEQLTQNGDEPQQLLAMLNDVCDIFSVNREHIFVGGLSAGGYMANILAAAYPDVFSGVMVNAGGAYLPGRNYAQASVQMESGAEAATGSTLAELAEEIYQQMGESANVVPMVVVQGMKDKTVFPQNGLDVAQCWAEVLHRIDENISTEPTIEKGEANGGTYTLYTYSNQYDNTAVIQLYMVDELDHWYATAQKKSPDAVEVSYDFFTRED